jgi:hypothetical protein
MKKLLLVGSAIAALIAAGPASAQVRNNNTRPGVTIQAPSYDNQAGWRMGRDPDPAVRDYLRHDPPGNSGD